MKKPNLDRYKLKFSEGKFKAFIVKNFKKIGMQVMYASLLMFYAYQQDKTPSWAKNIILGALGYLISPLDMLPDLTPVLGFTDDFGVLSFGLVTISCFITSDMKTKAKNKIGAWLHTDDFSTLEVIDNRL